MKRIVFSVFLSIIWTFSFGQSIPSITASFDYVQDGGGDYIEITIRPNISSNSSFSNDIYCDISFPGNYVSSIRQVDRNNWDDFGQYDEGEAIYHRNNYTFPAEYTLVSLERAGWDSNVNLEAVFKVYLNQSLEEYKIFYRATITETDNWVGYEIEPEDGQGDDYDQQGWPVYEFTVTPPLPDLDIAGTPDVVDENGNVISTFYVGDKIKIVADVDNDGDAYSGITDLRFYYNSSSSPWDIMTVDPIVPDGSNVEFISDLITLNQVGTNYIEVFVNEDKDFDEISFSNNDKTISFNVSSVPQGSLQVNVFNVGGATNYPGDDGRVELYSAEDAYVDEDETNSSGQAEFTELEPASGYRIEVFHDPGITIHGEEYWGKETGIDVVDGSLTQVDFERFMPYVESIDFYNNETDELLNGNDIPSGVEIRAEAVVRNNGGAFNVRTRLYVDRDESSSYDHELISDVQSIVTGGTVTYVFEFVPDNLGQYWYTIATETDYSPLGGYTITDGWDWSEGYLFNVIEPIPGNGSLQVNVSNVGGATNYPGDDGRVRLYNAEDAYVDEDETNSSGQAEFTELEPASGYRIEVFHDPGITIHGEEYWGKETGIDVVDGILTQVDFERFMPYVESIDFYNNETDELLNGNDIPSGVEIRAEAVVRNNGGAFNVRTRLYVDRDESSSYDHELISDVQSIVTGGTVTYVFEFVPDNLGQYWYTIRTETDYSPLGGYTNTDGWDWSEGYLFNVIEPIPGNGSLQVNVSNVGGATNYPGDDGRVELYNAEDAYVDEDETNSSGQAEFTELVPASGYRIEVFHDPGITIHGEEYWGKETGIDVVDGSLTQVDFERFMPYVESIDFYNNETDELLNGNDIPSGVEIRAEAVVRNNGGAFNVRTRLYVDRDKSSSYDHELISDVQSIVSGGAATYVFEFVPDNLGQYWYTIATETDYSPLGGYTITDGWDWSEGYLFNVRSMEGTASLEIIVQDEHLQNAPNMEVKLILDQATIENKTSDDQGIVYFESLNPGTYTIDIYRNAANRELWAKEHITVETQESVTIARNMPYVSDFTFIYQGKELAEPIEVGDVFTVNFSIVNPRSVSSDIDLRIILDQDPTDQVDYDIDVVKEDLVISGGSGIDIPVDLSFSIPGQYHLKYELRTEVEGNYVPTAISEFTIEPQIEVEGLEKILWLGKEQKDTIFEGDKLLLLVHGWQTDGSPANPGAGIWDNFLMYASGHQDFTETFEVYRVYYYSNYVTVDSLGSLLRDTLDLRAMTNPKFQHDNISMMGHSMGGLVSRAFMNGSSENAPFQNQEGGERVQKLITLGTPHHGSPMANGPIRNTLLTIPNEFLVETFDALLFVTAQVHSSRPNRHDLKWDNFDDLYQSYFPLYGNEQNHWLNELNDNTKHDHKIITYFGTFNKRTNKREVEYLAYVAGNSAMTEMGLWRFLDPIENDGIVPTSSAIFEGHNVQLPIRFFPGYDHSEIGTGSTDVHGIDEALFGSILTDLLELESRSIASIPGDQMNYGYSGVSQTKDSSINIINNGSVVINFETITLTGDDADQFELVDADESPLEPGDTRFIDVSFTPTSSGTKSTYLNIVNDSENASNMLVRLSGTGTESEVGSLEVSPDENIDLGNVLVSTFKNEVIQLTSTGAQAVSVLNMEMIGQDASQFVITFPSMKDFTIAANHSQEVIITFNANSIGSKTATLRIDTDMEVDPTRYVHFFADVTDNLNVAPVIYDARFSVNEHAPNGTIIGSMTAEDVNFDRLSFSILSSNRTGIVDIDPESGNLIVVDSKLLDHKDGRFIELIVRVTDEEFMDSATIIIEILEIDEPLGIDIPAAFSLYPNPSQGTYFLEIMNKTKAEQFTIVDLTGRIIVRKNITETNTIIDLSSEPDGVYFLYIGQKDFVIKLLKRNQ